MWWSIVDDQWMVIICGVVDRLSLTSSGPFNSPGRVPWQVGKLLNVQTREGATPPSEFKGRSALRSCPFPSFIALTPLWALGVGVGALVASLSWGRVAEMERRVAMRGTLPQWLACLVKVPSYDSLTLLGRGLVSTLVETAMPTQSYLRIPDSPGLIFKIWGEIHTT